MHNGFRLEKFGWHDIKHVDLALAPGECVGISGPSGSGKTLLLRAVADLDPHEGRAFLDDVASDQIAGHQWRRSVGYLPAEAAWWFDTVGEHLPDMPLDWLMQLGFSSQVLQWEIRRLSSGERQRLSLVRLLANRPRVLLLDEPTANLDLENTRNVEHFLAEYRSSFNPYILWVSHDPAQLGRWCSRIFRIGPGGFQQAAPADLGTNGGPP